jgi:hypothetical protein
MSIPSGKPGNSIDLWDYESRKARGTAAERYPTEDETNPLRSPYQSERASLLARSGILSKRTAIRFGRRRERVHNPL